MGEQAEIYAGGPKRLSNGESIWRNSKNPRVQFTNSQDFFDSPEIPAEAKGLYDKYIKETDPNALEQNDKGYYKTNWKYDDKENKATYSATYDVQYGWGIMKVPLKDSIADQKARFERMEKLLIKLCEFHKIDVSQI